MTTPLELTPTVHYTVTTDVHPGALPRVLELFALRNITPDLVKVRQFKRNDFIEACLTIHIHVAGLRVAEQEIIFHKLAAQISVQNVSEEILFQKARTKLAS